MPPRCLGISDPDALRRILREHGRIAVVGLSPRPERPSHWVSAYMAEDAIALGARVLWLQPGLRDPGWARRGAEAGLQVVMDRCIKVDHARLISSTNRPRRG